MSKFKLGVYGGGQILVFALLLFGSNVLSQSPTTPISNNVNNSIPPILELFDIGSQTACEQYGSPAPDIEIGLGATSGITNVTELSAFLGGNPNMNNRKIVVNGFFWVDVPWTLTDCEVRVSGGDYGQISILGSDVHFTAQNTVFYACASMWRGIQVGGTNKITLNHCRIEDAWAGIEMIPDDTQSPEVPVNPFLTIDGTLFNRNTFGLFCDGSGDAITPTINLGKMRDCLFTFNSPANENEVHPAGPNFIGGIAVISSFLTVGNSNNSGVTADFHLMSNGIYAYASTVRVNGRCRFFNSKDYNLSGAELEGNGILVREGSNLTIGVNQPSEFYSCESLAIKSIVGAIEVRNCLFVDNYGGIENFSFGIDFPGVTSIISNEIILSDDDRFGVNVCRPFLPDTLISNGVIISLNKISREADNYFQGNNKTDPSDLFGIRVICQTSVAPVGDRCLIEDNIYTDNSGYNQGWINDYGISVTSDIDGMGQGNGVRLARNVINYTNPVLIPVIQKAGIYINLPSANTTVKDNTINGANNQSFIIGLKVVSSSNATYCNNIVKLVGYGMIFSGVNNPSTLKTTQFGSCTNNGLLLFYSSIGTQDRYANTWATEAGSYGIAPAQADEVSAFLSRIWADQTIQGHYPLSPIPSTGWFIPASGANYECPFNNEDPHRTEADSLLFEGGYDGWPVLARWEQAWHTLQKLHRYEGLQTTDQEAEAYYDAQIGTTTGLLVQAAHLREGAFKQPVLMTIGASIRGQESLIEPRLTVLANIETALDVDGLPESNISALLAQWATTAREIAEMRSSITQLNDSAQAMVKTALFAAYQYNEAIVTSTPHESTEKAWLSVWMKGEMQGGFTAVDIETIQDIAGLQDSVAGRCVAYARMYLQPLPMEVQSRNNNTKWSARPKSGLISCKVIPNPSQGAHRLEFSTPMSGTWSIESMQGVLVASGRMTAQSAMTVDISGQPSGMYVFRLISDEGNLNLHKNLYHIR